MRSAYAHRARLVGGALVGACLSSLAFAQGLASPDPEGAGFSAAWLERIAPWYRSQVDNGAYTGATVGIVRAGKLAYLRAIGTYDRAGKRPLTSDAIFWIASMTKPVTSVAAMILVDEGKLDLDAPLEKYLPQFKDKQVAIDEIEPVTGKRSLLMEPAKRPIEVIDLLRHTSGLVYPEEASDVVHRLYGLARFRRDRTLAEFVASLAWLPLAHQPGEVWEYSWGVDVLARLIEVVSGQTFDAFLQSRIFKPLGMVDTGFFVPPDKLEHLVDPPPGGRPRTWDVTVAPQLFSGGGGLVSTVPDYLRFCQMLLNGGELDGHRILSAQSVKRMTTPSVPADIRFAGEVGQFVGPKVGSTWGLGFALRSNPDASLVPGAVGSFSWSGIWGTNFWIDPVAKLAVVQMLQILPEANVGQNTRALRQLTYAALLIPPPSAAVPSQANPPAEGLSAYVGTYDFGRSLSAYDKQAPVPVFSGIGAEVNLVQDRVVVSAVVEGAPAAQAGMLVDDMVSEVDGQPLSGLTIGQVHQKLTGPAGSAVSLKITRKAEKAPIDIKIIRRTIRYPGARIEVRVANGGLTVAAAGPSPVLDFEKDKPLPLQLVSGRQFRLESGERTRLVFTVNSAGNVSGVVVNPGAWQIEAAKLD